MTLICSVKYILKHGNPALSVFLGYCCSVYLLSISSGAMIGDGKMIKGDKLIRRRLKICGFHWGKLEEGRPVRKLGVDVDPG